MNQLTRQDLKGMSPEEINEAYEGNQFDTLLGADAADIALAEHATTNAVLTRGDLAKLHKAGLGHLIAKAHDENRINLDDTKDNS